MDPGWTPNSVSSAAACSVYNISTEDDMSANGEGAANTVIIAICASLLSLIIAVGNGLIIVSVALVKKLRQPANYLIVSLALSDFLVGFVVLPLTIVYDTVGEWVFGPMMCDIHVSFDVICCTASIMNLCMISIDRYLMITKPMTYPKKRTGKLMLFLIALAWIISCLIIIPALFGFTKNVKDEPGWIPLTPQAVVGASRSAGPAGVNGSIWRDEHSAANLVDGDPKTFWYPSAGSNTTAPRDSFFVLDLGQTYRLSSVRVTNAGDELHDVRQLDLQNYVCQNPGFWESAQKVKLPQGTEARQETSLNDLHLKVLRVNVTETYNNDSVQPILREFSVFGDKVHGKTCLISQEVWFTIYSTLGAFYLPLCVMLCMYWKIYLEASRFNKRHQLRAANYGGSQEWSGTPPATPDVVKSSHGSRDESRYIAAANNNYSMTVRKTMCSRISEGFDTNSEENLIAPTGGQGLHDAAADLTVVVTRAFDSDRSDNVFEDDTLSSECDFLAGDREAKRDDVSDVTAESDCASRRGSSRNEFLFSNGDVVANGYHVLMESSPRARQRALSASSFNSASGTRLKSHAFDSDLSSRAESTGNGLDYAGWRHTKTSQSTVSDSLSRNLSPTDNGVAGETRPRDGGTFLNGSRDVYSGRTRTMYTRTSTLSLARAQEQATSPVARLNRPRHSIFSGSSACCARPQFRRLSATPPSTRPGRTNIVGLKGVDASQLARRRSTVFHQIRRRVSLATSRDRMRNVKATRTLGIIVGAFTFCWLPFFIVTILRPFVCENPESADCIPLWLVRLVLWLGYLNSALNPVIYIGFSPDLRETFRLLVCCKCTNVDRRLAQTELRQAYSRERRESSLSRGYAPAESIM